MISLVFAIVDGIITGFFCDFRSMSSANFIVAIWSSDVQRYALHDRLDYYLFLI